MPAALVERGNKICRLIVCRGDSLDPGLNAIITDDATVGVDEALGSYLSPHAWVNAVLENGESEQLETMMMLRRNGCNVILKISNPHSRKLCPSPVFNPCQAWLYFSILAASCLHTFLCFFQSWTWQSRPQYKTEWHLAQDLNSLALVSILAQQSQAFNFPVKSPHFGSRLAEQSRAFNFLVKSRQFGLI